MYDYAMNLTVKEAISEYGKAALTPVINELMQMIKKQVWVPVHTRDAKRAIRSKMFLKVKKNSEGIFEKIKARLVAGGHMQDRSLYENLSSRPHRYRPY